MRDEANAAAAGPARASMNVLIVDDYRTMIRIIRNLLIQCGFEREKIKHTTDARDAIRFLRGEQFQSESFCDFELPAGQKIDLVIADSNQEPMSGLQLLQEIRGSAAELASMPFLMVTSESQTNYIIAAKQAGVSSYIVKPFNAETLSGKIDSALRATPTQRRDTAATPAPTEV